MNVKYLFSTLAILLATLTFFALDTLADTESASDQSTGLWWISLFLVLVLVVAVGMAYFAIQSARKENAFPEELRDKLSSEDPKVLLELSEKCDAYLRDRYSPEVTRLSQQAKDKATKIQQAKEETERIQRETERIQREIANLETFKSEISENGSHPRVVATLKETMHNPDSFQHVSSDYETVEPEGKRYLKIVITFRGRNTFNALVLQTCYFLVDGDNQISLVGSPDDTESSPVNTAQLAETAASVAIAFEGVATLADLLLFFTSEE